MKDTPQKFFRACYSFATRHPLWRHIVRALDSIVFALGVLLFVAVIRWWMLLEKLTTTMLVERLFWEGIVVSVGTFSAWGVVFLIKLIVNTPRPFILDPSLKPLVAVVKDQPGFPSAHAGFYAALAGSLFMIVPLFTPVVVVVAILVGVSRVMAGVHTLLDVVAGWVIGFCLAVPLTYLAMHTLGRFIVVL